MPEWITWVIGIAALITALGVIVSKVIRPGVRAAGTAEEMLPLLRQLTDEFRGTPNAFKILKEIIAQFRTDSGSTLRDVVNRLEAAAIESKNITEKLRVDAEADRRLDERDRQDIKAFMLLLDRLTVQVEALIQSGARIEVDREKVAEALFDREGRLDRATAGVAKELMNREGRVDEASAGVAKDLAAARKRADEALGGEAGAAADAASQSDEKKE